MAKQDSLENDEYALYLSRSGLRRFHFNPEPAATASCAKCFRVAVGSGLNDSVTPARGIILSGRQRSLLQNCQGITPFFESAARDTHPIGGLQPLPDVLAADTAGKQFLIKPHNAAGRSRVFCE